MFARKRIRLRRLPSKNRLKMRRDRGLPKKRPRNRRKNSSRLKKGNLRRQMILST